MKELSGSKLILLGVMLAILSWFMEAAIHAFVFFHTSFMDELARPDPHEAWMRALIVCLFILFGFYAQFLLNSKTRAEGDLRSERDMTQKYLDTAGALIMVTNERGEIVLINRRGCEILGYKTDEIIGKSCLNFLPEDSWTEIQAEFGEPIRKPAVLPASLEVPVLTKTGKQVTLALHSTLLYDDTQTFHGAVCSGVDITDRKLAEVEREKVINDLQDALAKVKLLSGFLPICASCKKIRDDQGYWQQIEAYIRDHSEVEFSHGICPECAKRLYPEMFEQKTEEASTTKSAGT